MKLIFNSILAIVALYILVVAFVPEMMSGIRGLRVVPQTEAFTVVTGGGVTTADVTLAQDLFQARLAEISGISSNISESPSASAYTEATKVLQVSGLSANTTRSLTITYSGEVGSQPERILYPFLGVVLVGGCAALILLRFFRSRH